VATKCPKCHSENPETKQFCADCGTQLTPAGQPPAALTKTLESPAYILSKWSLVAGKYRVLEEIGRGGMGVVYKAEDIKLKRPIALKFLPPQLTLDQDARERFVQEAQAASALDHPNICNIHEIEETEDGRMYIAMAFYEGESLRDKIKREPLDKSEALDIAVQVALGMEEAHGKGIVHRDIKPANILITNDGVAKIVDFGLAKLAGQVRMTKEGSLKGTVAYMSQEQAKGEPVDQRTDVWSLGVVLYEMVSGRLPFKGDYEQSLIHSILNRDPEPIGKVRKDLPKGLESIVLKALAKNPNARYQGMGEVLEDLKAVTEGLKPLRAKLGLFRGKLFGIKRTYVYAGLGVLVAFIGLMIALNISGLRDRLLGQTGAGQSTSLAVLPIKNYSGDLEQEIFADSMTDELIAGLGQIKAFKKVISRTSVMQYKDAKKPLPQIAKELGVERIVEASVMRSGGRVSITARLIDARRDRQLWAHTFEKETKDALTLQVELVQAIAAEIRVQVTPQESERLKAALPTHADAHDAFLMGKYFLSKWTQDGYKKAITYFQQCIDIEPTFAPAYVGLADAYSFAGPYSKVRPAVRKALDLDDNLAEAHAGLAKIMWSDWDWAGAQQECRRAVALNPNSSYVHFIYGWHLTMMGRKEEAVRESRRMFELDPLTPTSYVQLGWVLHYVGRYDESIAHLKKALELDPSLYIAHEELGWNYAQKKMYPEAVAECRQTLAVGSEDVTALGTCGHILALAGEREEALKCLESLKSLAARRNAKYNYMFAYLYDGLGEIDLCLDYLERSYRARDDNLVFLRIETFTDKLRSDPRFQDLLRRMNFPQ
jgi:TolB-like protein/Tfp pilus assembly protein PilF/predicted Ser/Thr protein kinase